MTNNKIFIWFFIFQMLISCDTSKPKYDAGKIEEDKENLIDDTDLEYASENLIIHKISENVYQHISYLNTESFGKVPCNGMIVVNAEETVIFDTPTTEENSRELIDLLTKKKYAIKAIVATHFHSDCLGGLSVFHENNIPSYALDKTIELTKKSISTIPENGFRKQLELNVKDKKIFAEYFGEGHTSDNIVGYFPDENVLFGGCLVKAMGAGKGNLEDANTNEWSKTLKKIKIKYPELHIVIPGHGETGGIELLDFSIELFQQK